ncbi:hypothetical protein PLICRDRAFT_54029 [Plicaturopsis crispa FD-325 SS-3]|nr:hypothetical protein PLICRDRAFT_54029 [Plicaturopsis crispa FD-325 SS-3]
MTDYTTSPEAIQEYISSKERTANWISDHVPSRAQFCSPSVPPSVIDDPDFQSYEPSESEAESTHSLPPRMVLKYQDGRPDVPISHWHYDANGRPRRRDAPQTINTRSGDRNPSTHRRSKSGSDVADRPHLASDHAAKYTPPRRSMRTRPPVPPFPENIQILPSTSYEPPQSILHSSHHSHRSRSQPRKSHSRSPDGVPHYPVPQPPPHSQHSQHSQHTQYPPLPTSPASSFVYVPTSPSEVHPVAPSAHPSQQSHHRPPRSPPAIVYAPSHHSKQIYAPPAMVYSHNAPSMKYSQSDPTPRSVHGNHSSNAGGTPYPSVHGSYLPSVHEERRPGRSQSRNSGSARSFTAVQRGGSRSPSQDYGRNDSRDSVSTYYVIPAAGQKVQIIMPDGERSMYSPTSTAKSSGSPQSPSLKKPFFQRLLNIVSSVDSRSSHGGRRLHRRHSTGSSGRRSDVSPSEK